MRKSERSMYSSCNPPAAIAPFYETDSIVFNDLMLQYHTL